jgi:hypothetical protein
MRRSVQSLGLIMGNVFAPPPPSYYFTSPIQIDEEEEL